jgi:hypothetical protein
LTAQSQIQDLMITAAVAHTANYFCTPLGQDRGGDCFVFCFRPMEVSGLRPSLGRKGIENCGSGGLRYAATLRLLSSKPPACEAGANACSKTAQYPTALPTLALPNLTTE